MNDSFTLFSGSRDLSHLQTYLQGGKAEAPLPVDSPNEMLRLLELSAEALEDMLQKPFS